MVHPYSSFVAQYITHIPVLDRHGPTDISGAYRLSSRKALASWNGSGRSHPHPAKDQSVTESVLLRHVTHYHLFLVAFSLKLSLL